MTSSFWFNCTSGMLTNVFCKYFDFSIGISLVHHGKFFQTIASTLFWFQWDLFPRISQINLRMNLRQINIQLIYILWLLYCSWKKSIISVRWVTISRRKFAVHSSLSSERTFSRFLYGNKMILGFIVDKIIGHLNGFCCTYAVLQFT